MSKPKSADRDRDAAPSALLVIDMINLFDFDGGRTLAAQALPAARRIAALKRRYHRAGRPVVYVNDNFLHWQADFKEIVALCARPDALGAKIAALLPPAAEDYFVLKPKHSAFLGTPLPILLAKLGVRRLVLTGLAADSCIAASAIDAAMREYAVEVPADCVAAQTAARRDGALRMLAAADTARIVSSDAVVP